MGWLFARYRESLLGCRWHHRAVRWLLSCLFVVLAGRHSGGCLRTPLYLRPAFAEAPGLILARKYVGAWRRIGRWQLRVTAGWLGLIVRIPTLPIALAGMFLLSVLVPAAVSGLKLAALSANTVVEIRTGGADTNGGGFVAGASGTDWSQQNAAQYAFTDGVTNGTTTFTSATASFGTDVVGNLMYVSGGTGSVAANWYQITARTNGTTITLDRSTGLTAGTGVTFNIGGALASIGGAGALPLVNGNGLHIKSGTYTPSSTSTNVSGGLFSKTLQLHIEGYQTTRGDMGTKPVFDCSGLTNTFTVFAVTSGTSTIRNIEVDCASKSLSRAFLHRGLAQYLKASNCTNGAFATSTAATWQNCYATGCSSSVNAFAPQGNGDSYIECVAENCAFPPFGSAGFLTCVRCLSINNFNISTDGFSCSQPSQRFINCVSYGNGRDGFRCSDSATLLENCIAEGNAGVGFNFLSSGPASNVQMRNCAAYNNTGGNVVSTSIKFFLNDGFVTGSGSFFTNAAGGTFTLNNTAGAGASLRAAGFPGALQYGGTGYVDIGAFQHQDAGSGGGPLVDGRLVQ